jgi:site-specific DNA recombinase
MRKVEMSPFYFAQNVEFTAPLSCRHRVLSEIEAALGMRQRHRGSFLLLPSCCARVTVDELDLEIHFVKENVVVSQDSRSSEKFMHGIKVLTAKNFIDNLSEETKKGMLEKAEQSIYPSFAPIGYRNVMGPNGKRIVEPNPEIAPIIKQIFEWYATGQCSLAEVTERACSAGLVSRHLKKPVSKSNIHYLLRKRFYTGDFDWKGKTYRGSHEPLISTGLYERVQEILDGRYSTKQKVTKHEFTFSGLVNCGHCGCALLAEKKKGKYVYYHCAGNKGKCPEPYTREEVLDECFGDLLKGLVFDDQVMGYGLDHRSLASEPRRREAFQRRCGYSLARRTEQDSEPPRSVIR